MMLIHVPEPKFQVDDVVCDPGDVRYGIEPPPYTVVSTYLVLHMRDDDVQYCAWMYDVKTRHGGVIHDLLDTQLILVSDKDTPVTPTPEPEKIVQESACICEQSREQELLGCRCPVHGWVNLYTVSEDSDSIGCACSVCSVFE